MDKTLRSPHGLTGVSSQEFETGPRGTVIFPLRNVELVYCGGPLFNAAERMRMAQIAAVLESDGFKTFLPQRDGLELIKLSPILLERGFSQSEINELTKRAVFDLDTYQLSVRCGSQVFNSSGRVTDEGVASEAGQAWIIGKPLVNFSDHDARALLLNGARNPLITGLAQFEEVDELEQLPAALRKKIQELKPQADYEVRVPEHVAKCLLRGSRLWQEMTLLRQSGAPLADRNEVIAKMITVVYADAVKRHSAQNAA